MTYRPNGDYNLDLAEGFITGKSGVSQRGRRNNVSTGSFDDITQLATLTYPFPIAAAVVRIAAGGNVNDTAAGTGARSVLVEGLDANLDYISEVIVTNGALASTATTALFWRINNVSVVDVGTYGGTAAGNINIETVAGAILSTVTAAADVSQLAIYSVPAGKTLYVNSIHIHVASSKSAQVRLVCRERLDVVAAPMGAHIQLKQYDDLQGEDNHLFKTYIPIPEKSDIWFQGQSNTTAGDISCELEGVLTTN